MDFIECHVHSFKQSVWLRPCNLSCFLSVLLPCYNTRGAAAGRHIKMRNWMWLQEYVMNKIDSPERIMFQQWEAKSKGRQRAQVTQLRGKINSVINHGVFLFLQGSLYLLSIPSEDEKQRTPSLAHHQSHTPRAISTSVFHPLSLASPINLSFLLSLTGGIHSVSFCSTCTTEKECSRPTYTQAGVNTAPVPCCSTRAIAFYQAYLLIKSLLITFSLAEVFVGSIKCFNSRQKRSCVCGLHFNSGVIDGDFTWEWHLLLSNSADRWSTLIVSPPHCFSIHKLLLTHKFYVATIPN